MKKPGLPSPGSQASARWLEHPTYRLGVDRSIKKRGKEGLSRPSFSSAPTFAPKYSCSGSNSILILLDDLRRFSGCFRLPGSASDFCRSPSQKHLQHRGWWLYELEDIDRLSELDITLIKNWSFIGNRLHKQQEINNMCKPDDSKNHAWDPDTFSGHHEKSESHQQRHCADNRDLSRAQHAAVFHKGVQMLLI